MVYALPVTWRKRQNCCTTILEMSILRQTRSLTELSYTSYMHTYRIL
jgi:hypothetical protein